ncbi:hypothetical protein, partial [Thermococcus waiotapuensis]
RSSKAVKNQPLKRSTQTNTSWKTPDRGLPRLPRPLKGLQSSRFYSTSFCRPKKLRRQVSSDFAPPISGKNPAFAQKASKNAPSCRALKTFPLFFSRQTKAFPAVSGRLGLFLASVCKNAHLVTLM